MIVDLNSLVGCSVLAATFWISSRAYRHAGRPYVAEKTSRIQSPTHFSLVYRWLQLSTAVAGFGAYLGQHPVLLDCHERPELFWVGQSILLVGLGLFVCSKRALGMEYSPCFDSWVARRVVRSGPYSRIRHPIYTANVTILVGLFVATGSLWLALNAVVLAGYYGVAAKREEDALLEHHPGYAAYRARTGRFLPC